MRPILTLYTGDLCHLCEQAKALIYEVLEDEEIRELGWRLDEVSITGNTQLTERYGLRIPVIVNPAGEEKGWPFTHGQIKRLLIK